MAKTVDIDEVQQSAPQETDQYGYYTINVNQILHPEDDRFSNSTIVKLKQKVQPAVGVSEVVIGISIHPRTGKKIDIPEAGFTVIMETVFVSRIGDMIQSVLTPMHLNSLVNIGANYVETILMTVPYSDEEYILLSPGTEFAVTVDLDQPPVELVGSEEEVEEIEDDETVVTILPDSQTPVSPAEVKPLSENLVDEVIQDTPVSV